MYERYFVDIAGIDARHLTLDWQWLIGDRDLTTWRVTALGDLFLKSADGEIWFLDTMEGRLGHFAKDDAEFEEQIASPRVRQDTLCSYLVRDLRAVIDLQPGECYSPDHPPVLGGSLDESNMKATDVRVHTAIMGLIHSQLKDTPPGTHISDIHFE